MDEMRKRSGSDSTTKIMTFVLRTSSMRRWVMRCGGRFIWANYLRTPPVGPFGKSMIFRSSEWSTSF